jgi:hypothetical protein
LNDTHFIFIGRNLEPTGLTTEEAVAQWREWERQLGLRNASNKWAHNHTRAYHSHEQKDLRKVLLETYGEQWIAWDTDYTTGIETVQDWWTPIEKEQPNPFRPQLNGRCQLMFVSLNNDYQLAYNERLASYFVTASQTEAGFMMLRKQISAYHYAESELGKAVKAMRPVKELDDIVDCIRGYAVNWNRDAPELTDSERIEQAIPEGYRLKDRLDRSPYEHGLTPQDELGYVIARTHAKAQVKPKIKVYNPLKDWGMG